MGVYARIKVGDIYTVTPKTFGENEEDIVSGKKQKRKFEGKVVYKGLHFCTLAFAVKNNVIKESFHPLEIEQELVGGI